MRVALISTKLVVREEYHAKIFDNSADDFFMRNHVLNYQEIITCGDNMDTQGHIFTSYKYKTIVEKPKTALESVLNLFNLAPTTIYFHYQEIENIQPPIKTESMVKNQLQLVTTYNKVTDGTQPMLKT